MTSGISMWAWKGVLHVHQRGHQCSQSYGLFYSWGQDLKLGLLALCPSLIHLFTEGAALKLSSGGPSTLIRIRSSTVLGFREDLMSDLILFCVENPLSHCADDTGRTSMIFTRWRMFWGQKNKKKNIQKRTNIYYSHGRGWVAQYDHNNLYKIHRSNTF